MTFRRRARRPGVSLTEVLAAIFIMAVGMLALLTLFPLGALQMAQALKDDRTATTASGADAVVRSHWRNNFLVGGDPILTGTFGDPQFGVPTLPIDQRLNYTGTPVAYSPTTTTVPSIPANRPSYPVLIDPLGWLGRSQIQDRWFVARGQNTPAYTASPNTPLIPRRNFPFLIPPPTGVNANANTDAIRLCSLTDDLTFDPNGAPAGSPLTRQGKYNWAALVQRPRFGTAGVADLTILVFDGRPPLLVTAGDEAVVPVQTTATYPVTIGARTVTVTVPNRGSEQTPLLRRGGWIMDGTIADIPIQNPPSGGTVEDVDFVRVRHANFYRVAALTEVAAGPLGTTYNVDLESPIRPLADGRTTFANTGGQLTYGANLYLFAGLSEVFERPRLEPDAPTN